MISEDMTILEIVENYPETLPVFKAYDKEYVICICCNSLFDPLDKVAFKYGIDLERMLADLNKALA